MYLLLQGNVCFGIFGLMCRRAIDPPHPSTSPCLLESLPSFLPKLQPEALCGDPGVFLSQAGFTQQSEQPAPCFLRLHRQTAEHSEQESQPSHTWPVNNANKVHLKLRFIPCSCWRMLINPQVNIRACETFRGSHPISSGTLTELRARLEFSLWNTNIWRSSCRQ